MKLAAIEVECGSSPLFSFKLHTRMVPGCDDDDDDGMVIWRWIPAVVVVRAILR